MAPTLRSPGLSGLIQALTHASFASSDSPSSVSGASDRHRRLWRRFPSHGGLCGRDESLVRIWGPGLRHVHRRPVGVDMVRLVGFSPSSLLAFAVIHLFVEAVLHGSLSAASPPQPGKLLCLLLCWYEAVITQQKALAYFSLPCLWSALSYLAFLTCCPASCVNPCDEPRDISFCSQ